MEELIRKLEEATEGGTALDMAIFTTAVQPLASPLKLYPFMAHVSHDRAIIIPPFTTSLDAALTLVPEGWTVFLSFGGDQVGPSAYVGDSEDAPDIGRPFGRCEPHVEAATPALALCIAALKARGAQTP